MEPYILLLTGLFLILLAIYGKSSNAGLKATGRKAEGIVFDFNGEPNTISDSSISFNDPARARIRFVTDKLEWVTAEINGKSGFSFTRNYKLGQKVIVYYDENNPNIFFVDPGILEGLTKLTIGMAGVISIAIGVYEFFNKT